MLEMQTEETPMVGEPEAGEESDADYARRWAASRGRMPLEGLKNKTWFWSCGDGKCEADVPPVVYLILLRPHNYSSEQAAWDALTFALSEIRKAVATEACPAVRRSGVSDPMGSDKPSGQQRVTAPGRQAGRVKMVCESCEEDDHQNCEMRFCECACEGRDGFYAPDNMQSWNPLNEEDEEE